MVDYEAPTWTNGSAPPINATNMQAISDNIEGTQVDLETLAGTVATNTDDIAKNAADIGTMGTTIGNQSSAIADIKTVVNASFLTAFNVSVGTGSFVSDSTYSGYSYKVTIAFSGITTDHVPAVMLSPVDSDSLNYSKFSISGTDVVYMWAKIVPESAITIPSITAIKKTSFSV